MVNRGFYGFKWNRIGPQILQRHDSQEKFPGEIWRQKGHKKRQISRAKRTDGPCCFFSTFPIMWISLKLLEYRRQILKNMAIALCISNYIWCKTLSYRILVSFSKASWHIFKKYKLKNGFLYSFLPSSKWQKLEPRDLVQLKFPPLHAGKVHNSHFVWLLATSPPPLQAASLPYYQKGWTLHKGWHLPPDSSSVFCMGMCFFMVNVGKQNP